jgi:hypothetical protein
MSVGWAWIRSGRHRRLRWSGHLGSAQRGLLGCQVQFPRSLTSSQIREHGHPSLSFFSTARGLRCRSPDVLESSPDDRFCRESVLRNPRNSFASGVVPLPPVIWVSLAAFIGGRFSSENARKLDTVLRFEASAVCYDRGAGGRAGLGGVRLVGVDPRIRVGLG